MNAFEIENFYLLASEGEQEITLPSNKDALRFRLRIYKERQKKKYNYLPDITILVRDNKIIAGPKGFDLANLLEFSPKYKEEVKRLKEKQKLVDDNELIEMQRRAFQTRLMKAKQALALGESFGGKTTVMDLREKVERIEQEINEFEMGETKQKEQEEGETEEKEFDPYAIEGEKQKKGE